MSGFTRWINLPNPEPRPVPTTKTVTLHECNMKYSPYIRTEEQCRFDREKRELQWKYFLDDIE